METQEVSNSSKGTEKVQGQLRPDSRACVGDQQPQVRWEPQYHKLRGGRDRVTHTLEVVSLFLPSLLSLLLMFLLIVELTGNCVCMGSDPSVS